MIVNDRVSWRKWRQKKNVIFSLLTGAVFGKPCSNQLVSCSGSAPKKSCCCRPPCRKRPLFSVSLYVRPEPVSVNSSFLAFKWLLI